MHKEILLHWERVLETNHDFVILTLNECNIAMFLAHAMVTNKTYMVRFQGFAHHRRI